jgi:putative ABC transport system permease protein
VKGLGENVWLGLENLRVHKLRSLLTMLGMIFGVAAVVAMLSIGAGAQQQLMAFIEQLGVRNVIVEAREAVDGQALQETRKLSPGLTFQDLRAIRASVRGLVRSTARKRVAPSRLLPKPTGEVPVLFGVDPEYRDLAGLQLMAGRFFEPAEAARAAPVCVLGEAAREALFGGAEALGEYVRVNEQWFRVVGIAARQVTVQRDVGDLPSQNLNNVIYVPLQAALLRVEDSRSYLKDEIDGVYLQLASSDETVPTASVVRALLESTHRGAPDFTLVVPAELLAQQRRTQRIFEMVMVAIASISLLVGGIGIMNIMLASILERTREIGVRRAVGARRADVVRQFLVETTLVSVVGGLIGILFGVGLSELVASLAGWSTIVTPASILLAFAVSVSVGLVFGIYPAVRAARLDPVQALHYE